MIIMFLLSLVGVLLLPQGRRCKHVGSVLGSESSDDRQKLPVHGGWRIWGCSLKRAQVRRLLGNVLLVLLYGLCFIMN
jgi:hypothetical protein